VPKRGDDTQPKLTPVGITFTCTHCASQASVHVLWGDHHTLPKGWTSRDVIPTYALCRRTDHVFACSRECRKKLDAIFPPPRKPKWFKYA
jgi:hypothetical protein